MKKLVISMINVYQKTPTKAHFSCIFLPTCSEYTKEAVLKYGIIKGLWLGFGRILRCHPWQKNCYDPLK